MFTSSFSKVFLKEINIDYIAIYWYIILYTDTKTFRSSATFIEVSFTIFWKTVNKFTGHAVQEFIGIFNMLNMQQYKLLYTMKFYYSLAVHAAARVKGSRLQIAVFIAAM